MYILLVCLVEYLNIMFTFSVNTCIDLQDKKKEKNGLNNDLSLMTSLFNPKDFNIKLFA